MTETPQEQVARLQHEVDQAKIDDLNRQLAAAQAAAGLPVTAEPATTATVSPPPPGHAQVYTVGSGQPIMINLSQAGGMQALQASLTPEVKARLTPQMQQLIDNFAHGNLQAFQPGSPLPGAVPAGDYQQGSFGQPANLSKRRSGADGPPLPPAPRKVPWHFRAVLFPWSWWTVWALFMVSVAPIALWVGIPLAGAVAGAITFLVVVFLRMRRDGLQLSLLKWGEVATVVNAEEVSVGTYYSGVTYSNVRMAQAHGWQVKRQWYSGPGTSTKITYDIQGKRATMGLHGLPYDSGVILADPRKPEHALCISSFAYDLDRDPSGNWIGNLPTRVVIGSVAMTVILFAWTIAMIWLFTAAAIDLGHLVR